MPADCKCCTPSKPYHWLRDRADREIELQIQLDFMTRNWAYGMLPKAEHYSSEDVYQNLLKKVTERMNKELKLVNPDAP